MTTRLTYSILLLLATVFVSCKKDDLTFELNEAITIPFDKTATFRDDQNQIEFHFKNLVDESRCINMSCIWAGRAVVEVEINNDTTVQLANGDLTAPTDSPFVDHVAYEDYTVELKGLSYGKKRHYGNEEKYSIIIEVGK